MGWKNVKTHYRIGHVVAFYRGEGLCIGSAYVHNIMSISAAGDVSWGKLGPSRHNDDLTRYYAEMTADKAKLLELLNTPDTFEKCVTVYTYAGATILEKQCEEPGWPNVTHDGEMMYDNSHHTDKAKVVAWAKGNTDASIAAVTERLEEQRREIADREAYLAERKSNRAKLEADYPDIPPQ